jgi:hypothetical protein
VKGALLSLTWRETWRVNSFQALRRTGHHAARKEAVLSIVAIAALPQGHVERMINANMTRGE